MSGSVSPLAWWRRWRRAWQGRRLLRERIPQRRWGASVASAPVFAGLSRRQRWRLRELSSWFLREKHFSAGPGLELKEAMTITIAAQACLLILELDRALFDGWSEIIVYPDTFLVEHETQDEAGVVHPGRRSLSGEAWTRGPVILSWREIEQDRHRSGANVILHEFAHKLDMANGVANGMPPLHRDMVREDWTREMSQAYQELDRRLHHHRCPCIDPYAAESPAEFFAVCSEEFFEAPDALHRHYPGVYGQLRRFYRQDPLRQRGG